MTEDGSFERRLEELRRAAAETGYVDAAGARAAGSPMKDGVLSACYGQPLLKRPVWTWEIPAYFFVGGAAGAASVIGTPPARQRPVALVRPQ